MGDTKPTYTVWTAVVLVAFYLGLTGFMFWYAGGDPAVWQQRLVVYNGFTAFAATAAGVLLGTQIQQANVTAARTELAEKQAGIKALIEDVGEPGAGGAEAFGPAANAQAEALRRRLVDLL